jgi:hypothetical protein
LIGVLIVVASYTYADEGEERAPPTHSTTQPPTHSTTYQPAY